MKIQSINIEPRWAQILLILNFNGEQSLSSLKVRMSIQREQTVSKYIHELSKLRLVSTRRDSNVRFFKYLHYYSITQAGMKIVNDKMFQYVLPRYEK